MFNTLAILLIPNVWVALEAIATALMEKTTLSSDEVHHICSGFISDEDYEQAAEHVHALITRLAALAKEVGASGNAGKQSKSGA
jgi:hypothetical protein